MTPRLPCDPFIAAARVRVAAFAVALAAALFVSGSAFAQSADSESASATEITATMIESRLAQVQGSSAYDEKTRTEATELYRRALANLAAAEAHREAASRLEQARESMPRETEEARNALAAATGSDPLAGLDVGPDTPVQEIEQRLQKERADATAAQARLSEVEQSLTTALARPQAVRQRQAGIASESRDIAAQTAQAPSASTSDVVTQARGWAQQAATRSLSEEARKLEQELLNQPLRIELLEARRNKARFDVESSQARVRELQSVLAERRQSETERMIANIDPSELGEATDHPLVRELVGTNAALGAELEDLTLRLRSVTEQNQQAESELQSLERRYQNARQKLDVAGVSPAMGQYLAEERRNLPEQRDYRRESRERETHIAEAGLRDIRLEESKQQLLDVDQRVTALLEDVPPEEAQTLREPLAILLAARQDLLRQLSGVNDAYLRELSEHEYTESQLHRLVQDYEVFLSERLMWVRSQPPLTPAALLKLPGEVAELLAPTRWIEVGKVFVQRLSRSPLLMASVLVLLLFSLRRGKLRAALRATASRVGKPSEDTFASTLKALAITAVMTLPWPLFTGITGYELSASDEATTSSQAVGMALLAITPLLFFLRGFRLMCAPGGVAEGHFRWRRDGLSRLRRQMDLLLLTLLAPAFILVTAAGFTEAGSTGVLIQIGFVVLVAGLIVFLYRLLVPHRGILRSLSRRPTEGTVLKWPWFWLIVSMSLPALLGVMALAGFIYSAGTLLEKLINTTLWLVFGLILLRELAVRWLLVMRRRLLLRETLQRREAAQAAREAEGAAPVATDETAAGAVEDAVDVVSLDADTRKLLNVALAVTGLLGLGAIWFGVLPALGAFSDITLWQYVRQVGSEQQIHAITLADILVAALAVVLTVVAARNVPSLLEIVLRQRPSITPGSRLAFATLVRYGIAGIGLTFVLVKIGVDWSKLQWLVAALGVGIGFGLQEIVANFISGLIILVERPVRVGDVVTVGDASGVVTRVQIRATTIRTWDRQELLVPNKEFITGRVLNWSLTDDVLRIHFLVGVAYGSDVEKALALMEEACREHPAVLDDPAPMMTFESFGDNTLNLGLRCFVPSIEVRLQTITDLHRAINRKFNEAGIVIAFPQRDVHLDTSSPLEIRVLRGAGTPGADR